MYNLLHVAVHHAANHNAGDTLLAAATRRCFEHTVGPIAWTLHQAWAPFDVEAANRLDGVVVGGGGMFLADQTGASYAASGWQWNCPMEALAALTVPLIVFGVGYNQFPGQAGFLPIFPHHLRQTLHVSEFFGVRERAGIAALLREIPGPVTTARLWYQPCPTTALWQLYPAARGPLGPGQPPTLGVNVALDRATLRLQGRPVAPLLQALAAVCDTVAAQGWAIRVLCHKPEDAALLPFLRPGLAEPVALWEAPPEAILQAYRACRVVLGMRGHAQLIPCGLRIPFVTVCSHDKVRWFLEDIGQPTWGVAAAVPDLVAALAQPLRDAMTCPARPTQVAAIQEALWAVTARNMAVLADVLATAPRCA